MQQNSNCLEDMQCPKCGQSDSFRIRASSIFTVFDEGTEDHEDVEWDDDSPAWCTNESCNWVGCVKNLYDKDYMSQSIWDTMSARQRKSWQEERGIEAEPRMFAPYVGTQVRVEYQPEYEGGRSAVREFWVGRSSGWRPVYLELTTETSSSGGEPVDGEGIISITRL